MGQSGIECGKIISWQTGRIYHIMVYGMDWRASHGIMVWPDMWYGMALRVSHGIVWPGGHRMAYGMAWQARHWVWHSIWYGLAGMAWYMVCPGGHGMVYEMSWRARNGVWYGLVGKAWCMVYAMLRFCWHVPDPFTSKGHFICMFRSHIQLLFTLGRDSK